MVVVVGIAVYVIYIQSILCSRAGVADGAMLAVSEYEVSVGPESGAGGPSARSHGAPRVRAWS
jgi:hypothetical protein